MPGGDRRGPMGQGPRSGRGLGFCSGSPAPGWSAGYGGFGGGRTGRGGGFRHRWFQGYPGRIGGWGQAPAPAVPDPEAERRFFKEEADALRRRLDEVERRLAAMQAGNRFEE